jgi:hypothetical protein
MQPGEYHDVALPRPSYEGLFGTIHSSRCGFFGLGYNRPEWCTWEWLKQTGAAQHGLDLIELGAFVVESFENQHPVSGATPLS